jgi:hypothetical protein
MKKSINRNIIFSHKYCYCSCNGNVFGFVFFPLLGLPSSMRESLPLYKDGLEYWGITEYYVRNYINIYYSSDDETAADVELVEYWNDFARQLPGRDFGLPSLGKEGLIKQLTHSIFHVTGYRNYLARFADYGALLLCLAL